VWIAFRSPRIDILQAGSLSFTKNKFTLLQFWRKDLAPRHGVSCHKYIPQSLG
jgi:hypothetical protein